VEDRNGRVILDPERDLRLSQRRLGSAIQVISPQNAYIMASMLRKTVEIGTLAYASGYGSKFTFQDEKGSRFRIPAAGKTGTPQNWSDAWAVGFTPYHTTAVWFGFDKPGNSLGVTLTGATLAGPVWGDYMRDIHRGLPMKDFVRPVSGLIDVTVCAKSGLLKTASCNEGEVTLPFLTGTQPTQYCGVHGGSFGTGPAYDPSRFKDLGIDDQSLTRDLSMPTVDWTILPDPASRSPLRPPESPPPGPAVSPETGSSGLWEMEPELSGRPLEEPPVFEGVPGEEWVEPPAYNPLLDL
jgi:penicillin-binding protein 1A